MHESTNIESEGEVLSPPEFVELLENEALAEMTIEKESRRLFEDSGKLVIEGRSVVVQPGMLGERLRSNLHDVVVTNTRPLSEHGGALALEKLSSTASAKIDMVNRFEDARAYIPNDLERNALVTRDMCSWLLGIENPPGDVYYFEYELGVAFIATSKASYDVLAGYVSGRGTDHSSLAGQTTYRLFFSDGSSVPVCVILQTGEVTEDGGLRIDHATYSHERRHSIDRIVFDAEVSSRFDRLLTRAPAGTRRFSNITEEGYRTLGKEILSFTTNSLVKGWEPEYTREIFTEFLSLPEGYNVDRVLSGERDSERYKLIDDVMDKLYGTNWEHKILKDRGSYTNKQEYKRLVAESVAAITGLQELYRARGLSKYDAGLFAIAILDKFPVQDWNIVAQGIKRFSKFKA